MKTDVSSIFYIVISILILVVTGLSRRKKKPIVPKPGLQNMQGQAPGVPPDAATSGRENRISDPFERLERMFIQPEADIYSEAVSQVEQEIPKEPLTQESCQSQEKEKQYQKLDLFKCVNDLKKAVIYAEILNRKEY